MSIQNIKQTIQNFVQAGITEAQLQACYTLYGKSDTDIAIVEINAQIQAGKLDADRVAFVNTTFGQVKDGLPNIDDLLKDTTFIALTKDLSELPRFEIFMTKSVTKTEGQPDVVTYSWSTASKFSTSQKPSTAKEPKLNEDGTVAEKEKRDVHVNVDEGAPEDGSWNMPAEYTTWVSFCKAIVPEEYKAEVAKGVSFSARRFINALRTKNPAITW